MLLGEAGRGAGESVTVGATLVATFSLELRRD